MQKHVDVCRQDCATRPWFYSTHCTAAHPPAVCSLMTKLNRRTASSLRLRRTYNFKKTLTLETKASSTFSASDSCLYVETTTKYVHNVIVCYKIHKLCTIAEHYTFLAWGLFFIIPLFQQATSICDWLRCSYSLLCVRQFAFIKGMFRVHFIL